MKKQKVRHPVTKPETKPETGSDLQTSCPQTGSDPQTGCVRAVLDGTCVYTGETVDDVLKQVELFEMVWNPVGTTWTTYQCEEFPEYIVQKFKTYMVVSFDMVSPRELTFTLRQHLGCNDLKATLVFDRDVSEEDKRMISGMRQSYQTFVKKMDKLVEQMYDLEERYLRESGFAWYLN